MNDTGASVDKEAFPWKNRIVDFGVKPADQFQAHPDNWRRHPLEQRRAVRGSLNELGWVDVVVESARTGHLIDGHERVWQALDNDNADVPFIQVDLSEEEEKLALAVLDPITDMATADADNLDRLLRDIRTGDEDLRRLIADLAASIEDFEIIGVGFEESREGKAGHGLYSPLSNEIPEWLRFQFGDINVTLPRSLYKPFERFVNDEEHESRAAAVMLVLERGLADV